MNKILFILIVFATVHHAQFIDQFDKGEIEGWFAMVGDGNPELSFIQNDGYSTMYVDGTLDKYNVYWTLIKRDITKWLDLTKLKNPKYQLKVEAKVRLHDAPRRINFMVNTNRTTDFHIDLMEFYIPDTTDWHVISMTTKKFDALPGDTVYVQLAATDFGLEKYEVDIDYYRADIVNIEEVNIENEYQVPYHPPIKDVSQYSNFLNVKNDCTIDLDFPNVNFNDLHSVANKKDVFLLNINSTQWSILSWDFSEYQNKEISKAGLLELTTNNVVLGGDYIKTFGHDYGMEFGKVRVIEILGGDSLWDQNKVCYNSLTENKKYSEVFNSQMVYDFDVVEEPGGKNYITISRPVMQRLLDGTTKGLLLRSLGAIDVSFYASENQTESNTAKLYFTINND